MVGYTFLIPNVFTPFLPPKSLLFYTNFFTPVFLLQFFYSNFFTPIFLLQFFYFIFLLQFLHHGAPFLHYFLHQFLTLSFFLHQHFAFLSQFFGTKIMAFTNFVHLYFTQMFYTSFLYHFLHQLFYINVLHQNVSFFTRKNCFLHQILKKKIGVKMNKFRVKIDVSSRRFDFL